MGHCKGSVSFRVQRLCHCQVPRVDSMQEANQTGMIHVHLRPFSKLRGADADFCDLRVVCLVSLSGSASMSFITWGVSPHPRALPPGHLSCSGGLHLCHHCPSASGQHPDHGEKPRRSAWLWCPGLFFIFLGSTVCILLAGWWPSVTLCVTPSS